MHAYSQSQPVIIRLSLSLVTLAWRLSTSILHF